MRDTLSLKHEVPRLVALNKESITALNLHVFGNANVIGSCSVVYLVTHHPPVSNQGLGVSKSRISKKNLIISRLELVPAHMASDLIENVKAALKSCNIRLISGLTGNAAVLHWLSGLGLYKQFVANKVTKIFETESHPNQRKCCRHRKQG